MAGKEAEIGALGIIVLVGVLGRLFLKKTGFSDVFLLLLFGAAVGALLPFESVGKMAELMLPIGAVTLLIIILNEGLHLPLKELLHLPKAVFFSILSFALSFAAAFSISYIFFQDVLVSLLIGAVFSSVAPELLSGFLSAREAHESAKAVAEIEATLSDALSVMLSLLLLSYLSHEGKPLEFSVYEIGFLLSLSCALGAVFAAGWKLAVPKIAEGNEHLAAIGIAAVLYAVSGLLHANGVISVFVFGFFLGNLSHKSVEEMRRFHSEISFFLRTAFFVYLGVLLFHSPKPMEVALFAAILSLLLAISRSLASKVSSLLEPSMRKGRLLEAVSGRGLTSAVLAVIVGEELHIYGHSSAVDFPLLALFVIFFTNAISAFLVFSNRKKE
ncbi:MAG: cation:proton antiporter [Candidatus Anstonellaceae archaeon]